MAWNTKTSTLLGSAIIGEAVLQELLTAHFKTLDADARKAAEERISAQVRASTADFIATLSKTDPRHIQMLADAKADIEPMLKEFLDRVRGG